MNPMSRSETRGGWKHLGLAFDASYVNYDTYSDVVIGLCEWLLVGITSSLNVKIKPSAGPEITYIITSFQHKVRTIVSRAGCDQISGNKLSKNITSQNSIQSKDLYQVLFFFFFYIGSTVFYIKQKIRAFKTATRIFKTKLSFVSNWDYYFIHISS